MALDKMSGMNPGMNAIKPDALGGKNPLDRAGGTQGPASKAGVDFKRALEQAASNGVAKPAVTGQVQSAQTAHLGNAQKVAAPQAALPSAAAGLKFSNHAVERMHSRGISFGADEMKGIENAITKAAQKGAKDTLVLSGDNALIVSVKNKTVVTVMDRAAMKENVFTNIDSTVVL